MHDQTRIWAQVDTYLTPIKYSAAYSAHRSKHTQINTHTHTHTRMHARTQARMQAHTHTHTYIYLTHTHARTHARTHAHTHTHTHTNTLLCPRTERWGVFFYMQIRKSESLEFVSYIVNRTVSPQDESHIYYESLTGKTQTWANHNWVLWREAGSARGDANSKHWFIRYSSSNHWSNWLCHGS